MKENKNLPEKIILLSEENKATPNENNINTISNKTLLNLNLSSTLDIH
jgi:hypothetical protein